MNRPQKNLEAALQVFLWSGPEIGFDLVML